MEWLKQLLEGAEIKEGKLDVDNLIAAINKELPKHHVPKETFNATNEQLKTANQTITNLKKNNLDNEELQNTINTYKTDIENLKNTHAKELADLKINSAITDILSKNGAIHVDLLKSQFNKENIKVNEDGTISGIEEQFNTIKEKYKDQFKDNTSNKGNDSNYTYKPKAGGEDPKGTISFIDIIKENQVRK